MEILRRTVIQAGMTLLLLGRGTTGASAAALARVNATAGTAQPPGEEPEPLTRYRFNCLAGDGTRIGDYSSLGEVWAATQYLRIVRCDVRYVGAGPHILTTEEAAAVNAARAAGSKEPSSTALFLRIITGCTRINPKTLQADLALLGAPVVQGALTLAPRAPQAAVFRRWLRTVP
jgi:hypothetical protein